MPTPRFGEPLDKTIHIEIGRLALAVGVISAQTFLDVMSKLQSTNLSAKETWLDPGFLTEPQLEAIYSLVSTPGQAAHRAPTLLLASRAAVRSTSIRGTYTTLRSAIDRNDFELAPYTGQIERPKLGESLPIFSEPRMTVPPAGTDRKQKVTERLSAEWASETTSVENGQLGEGPAEPAIPGDDRYVLVKELGSGSTGIVAEYIDLDLGRRVAIKSLQPELIHDGKFFTLLEQEAQVTARLEHPNIVPVYDTGKFGDGAPFYVMRLVTQPTLGDVLEQVRIGDPEATAKYTENRLLRAFLQVCNAVQFAHTKKVIHCDLKPANILLGENGEVLVADWGMAYGGVYEKPMHGGTLGYMPPEQIMGASADARADVFALGAILYEVIALDNPYPDITMDTVSEAVRAKRDPLPPFRPLEVAKPGVAPELREICCRAMAYDPEQRFQSVRELSEAVESFLEGTSARERREREADELVTQGLELERRYFELLNSRPGRVEEIRSNRRLVEPWDPPDKKRLLWEAEERMAVTDALGAQTLHAAVAAFELALAKKPSHLPAHAALLRLFTAELKRAEERRDEFAKAYFDSMVREHASVLSDEEASAVLDIQTDVPCRISIDWQELRDRRLITVASAHEGSTPLDEQKLSPGNYIIVGHDSSGRSVREPVALHLGERTSLRLSVSRLQYIDADEVLIPEGKALLGGSDTGFDELRSAFVNDFVVQKHPVSVGQYLKFVAARFRRGDAEAMALLPLATDGTPLWVWSGDGFRSEAIRRFTKPETNVRGLPVFGMTAKAAITYAEWWSARKGRAYRLPCEDEWEKAARGNDGRRYPWGDHFDASFCKMRDSRKGAPFPEPLGAFETDVSPYGVCDMAGSVAEWVTAVRATSVSALRTVLSKGGAWCDSQSDCITSAQRQYRIDERSVRIGFRLVCDLPEGKDPGFQE